MIDGYSEPYCFDWNRNGGGILIHIREDIPSNLIADHKLPHDIEGIFGELNLRKKKWLIFGSYNPLRIHFNAEDSEPCLSQFLFEMNTKK